MKNWSISKVCGRIRRHGSIEDLFVVFLTMHKKIPSFLLFFLMCSPCFAQQDIVGSGRTVHFDGVDDYVEVGNIYDNLTFPMTIGAWVYKETSSFLISPIFVSQDNAPLYNGFWFCLSKTNLFFEYGDGHGDQNPAFRRGKSAPVSNIENRWIYVTAVVKGRDDIQLFANGKDVGGSYTGSSTLPMASNYPGDVAKIGYFFTNSVTHRFKGMIDDIRIWNRALTEQEIREAMCRRFTGTEPGLIGYWNLDETSGDVVSDNSPNGFNGTVKGNAERVFSGAPIGDESAFLYTTSWPGKELSHKDMLVSNIGGVPFGVHIYFVNNAPSQTGGLGPAAIPSSYYGIFLADDSGTNTFDFSLTDTDAACSVFERLDNSVPDWNPSLTFSNIPARVEIIPSFGGEDFHVSLGPDVRVCDETSHVLKTDVDPEGKSFLWSNGARTSSITVTSAGMYAVEVTGECATKSDTIFVSFPRTPPVFSLGDDEELCAFKPRILAVDLETNEFDVTWHDGSSEEVFLAENFGTYWVKVASMCGVVYDSITFTEHEKIALSEQYNFISPNDDDDRNKHFVLHDIPGQAQLTVFNRWGKEVYHASNYDNRWDGGTLASGVYFYTITGECIEPYKGTLTIMR